MDPAQRPKKPWSCPLGGRRDATPALRRGAATWAALLALAPWAASAQTLTVDTTNSPYVVSVPTSFASVEVVDGGVLVANAPLTVSGSLRVGPGGLITIDAPDAGTWQALELRVSGTATVEAGGAIDASGKGLAPGQTIQRETGAVIAEGRHCTGAHATAGACVTAATSPPAFDEPLEPRLPGAGGFDFFGGGVVRLTADALVLDGRLAADGTHANPGCCYAGAGGTVVVEASAFSGSGRLHARGGSLTSAYAYSSGGLVLLRVADYAFTGEVDVEGGNRAKEAVPSAQAGSALLRQGETLTVLAGRYRPTFGARFASVALRAGSALDLEDRVTIDAPVDVPQDTTLRVAHRQALEAVRLGSAVDGTLRVEVDAVIATPLVLRGTLELQARLDVPSFVAEGGALVTHDDTVTSLHLVAAGLLRIAAGARVDVTQRGLPARKTIDPATGVVIGGSDTWNGGSHGGLGGLSTPSAQRGATYDDPMAPRFGGGGGGYGVASGGGVARLTAALLDVEGVVWANGAEGSSATGAGGSVVLRAGRLEGAGQVHARGLTSARTTCGGGGGGGGRSLIEAGDDAFTGDVSVAGAPCAVPGEPGSIVRRTAALGPVVVGTAPSTAEVGVRLTYRPVATGTPPFAWALVGGPSDAELDGSSGALAWTPATEGVTRFELQVSNAFGSARHDFTVAALRRPSITSTPRTAAGAGSRYAYDDDGLPSAAGTPPFAWSVDTAPEGLTVDPATGRVAWIPAAAGRSRACLRVTNLLGSDTQCFDVEVSTEGAGDLGRRDLGVGCGCGPGATAGTAAAAGLALAPALALVALAVDRRRRRGAPNGGPL